MLRGVQLQRFRGFAALTAELGPVTAIVGKNSSGKTSILHAVRLVCKALAWALEDDDGRPRLVGERIEVCREVVVNDPTRLVALADWRQLFTDAEVGEGVTVSIKLTFEANDSVQDASLVLAYGRNAQLKMSIDVASKDAAAAVAGVAIRSARRSGKLRDELRRIIPVAVFVPAFYGVTRLEEYRTLPVVTRLLGAGDQSHIVRNLLARMDGGALERLNGFLRRAVGAEIVQRVAQGDAEQRDNLAVTYRDTNGELELSSAGAGLVGLVALYAAMERTRAVRERGTSVPVMFLLDRSAGSVEILRSESETIRALDEFCDLTPFASLSFLSSRRILFYEGPGDLDVLEACARLYFRSDDARARRWRQYTPVPLDGVGNSNSTTLLRKLLTSSMFARINAADPVRAAVALDRDWGAHGEESHRHGSGRAFAHHRHDLVPIFDPTVLVPDEIRAFLDALIAT